MKNGDKFNNLETCVIKDETCHFCVHLLSY